MKISYILSTLLCINFLPRACFSQEGSKTTIPHASFYEEALRDSPQQAAFDEVAEELIKKSIVLVDVRSREEFDHSHIKGAINIPATDLTEENLSKFIPDKNSRIVIYCDNNFKAMSRMVGLTTLSFPVFKQLGYRNVRILECALSPDRIPLELVPPVKK